MMFAGGLVMLLSLVASYALALRLATLLALVFTLVIFSANVQASSKARAEELGIRFIAKPITEAVVRQALEAWEAEHG